MSKTKNLGQVSGVFIGMSAPKNTSIIWYDDTPSQRCHKVYDPVTNSWVALSPDIVSNTTYSELIFNAQKNGLSIGKHYVITDKSNVLAIAITATKVQYPDSLGNILVDDLGTNIQYHVSSSNLLIDDLSGVFNVESNKLVFQFQEQENVNINTDYLFGKVRSGTKWVLSKFRFSSLISKDANNSISWSNGLFFSFKNAINKILNKSGGVVGYDDYTKKVNQIDKSIESVSKNNQEIVANADKSITDKTKDSVIYDKKLQSNIDVVTAPGDVLKGDSLFTIVSKFQRWINRFKYATGISLSKSFADARTQQYINNNDTVESAFAKVQYMLKNPTTSGMLPENWTTGAKRDEGGFADPSVYSAFHQDGFPVAGDSIFYAFAKIVDFIQGVGECGKLSSTWQELEYSGTVAYPGAGDTFDNAFQKLVAKFKQLGSISNGILEYIDTGNSMRKTTIFNLKNGSLQFNDSYGGTSILDGYSLQFREEYEAHYGYNEISMKNETNSEYFLVNSSKFQYKIDTTSILKNGMYSSALIETTENYSGDSCAFQASASGGNKNTYDAYFGRLKLGSFTFNTVYVSAGNYYITRQKGFIVWNGSSVGNLYLPSEPENGLMILISQDGNTGFNVFAQGNDEIDTIGESVKNVGINERGCVFAFIYISGIKYGDKTNSGLWQCSKWDNKF